jgi:hypothetical protein
MFRGLIKLCAALLIFGLVISAWSTGLNGPFLWLLAGTLLWCGGLLVVYLVYRTLKGWLMPSDDTYGSATWAT